VVRFGCVWTLLAISGCAPDPPSIACTSPPRAVEVALQPHGRSFLVPVTVNGHTLQMLLDTGGITALTEAGVERGHIPRSGELSVTVGYNGGGMRPLADVANMSLGEIRLPERYLNVMGYTDSQVDGFIGYDVATHYDLDIDGPNRTLRLYPAHCLAAPPWASATLVEGVVKTPWLAIPLTIDGVQELGVIDTGASLTSIRSPTLRRLGLTDAALTTDPSRLIHIVNGTDTRVYFHKFHTVQVGPVTVHDVALAVVPGDPPALVGGDHMPDVLIGQDLLRTRRVWFSYTTSRLYL
jgi:predicted aspartyl protease